MDKFNIIPKLFPKKVGTFIPLEMLEWVMTACWVLPSRFTYFWRNLNISGIFYFSKSTSINTYYSSLWDTLKMMLFTKNLIKWKRIGEISWKFRYWFNLSSSIELDIKRYNVDVILVQCPFKFDFEPKTWTTLLTLIFNSWQIFANTHSLCTCAHALLTKFWGKILQNKNTVNLYA